MEAHCDRRVDALNGGREMNRVIAAAALCAFSVAAASAHSCPNLNIGQCRIQVQQVRLAESNRYTLGPPCMVFKNPTKTKAYMRALLLGNGFDSVGIPPISSRQFRFRAFKKRHAGRRNRRKDGETTARREEVVCVWACSDEHRNDTVRGIGVAGGGGLPRRVVVACHRRASRRGSGT